MTNDPEKPDLDDVLRRDNPLNWRVLAIGSALFEVGAVVMVTRPPTVTRLLGVCFAAGGGLLWADRTQAINQLNNPDNQSPTEDSA